MINEELKNRIKELQAIDVMNAETREEAKAEIVNILKNASVDEIRELLGNETKIHSVVIQKGGVGKSTASLDLCFTLAKMGFSVLGVDSDPQGSLTMLCNVESEDEDMKGLHTIYDVYFENLEEGRSLEYEEIKDAIHRPTYKKPAKNESGKWEEKEFEFGFDFIPTNLDLAGYDLILAKPGHGYVLSNVLKVITKHNHYDFVIIDSLPGLHALSYNCIMAAATGGCIVPINLEPMTVKGAKNLVMTTSEIQHISWERGIVHKGIVGIIRNQYSPRMSVQRKYDDVVKELFPISIFDNTIPNKTVCDKAHSLGRAFSDYDPKTGEIFKELCYEIIAEDIRRNNESEPVFVDEFGVELWDEFN